MTEHKHIWKVNAWSKDKIHYQCKCGKRFTRFMDKEEIAFYKNSNSWFRLREPRKENVHYVWHRMPIHKAKNFEKECDQNKKIKMGDKIEKFSKKYPKEVFCLGCDDSYYASSDLILVTHEAKKQWHGVSVLMIPQCDGRPPAEFFLYPHHLDDLYSALGKIRNRSKKLIALQEKERLKRDNWWNKRDPRPEKALNGE